MYFFPQIGWFVAVQNEYCTQEIGGKDDSETIDCSAVECQKFKTLKKNKIETTKQPSNWLLDDGKRSFIGVMFNRTF